MQGRVHQGKRLMGFKVNFKKNKPTVPAEPASSAAETAKQPRLGKANVANVLHRLRGLGKLKLITIAVVGLSLVGVGAFLLLKDKPPKIVDPSKLQTPGICSEELLTSAGQAIQEDNTVRVGEISAEILKKPNFDQDQNCLFVLVRYGTMRNNIAETNKYLPALKKIYNPDIRYSNALDTIPFSPEEFEELAKSIGEYNRSAEEQMKQEDRDQAELNKAADAAVNGN